ncbi:ABC transporter ATP-binding protein [Hutsoniella sourekii]|uniref:ABC transporter ATP-binding protein n=1 Tax=Hutsoniella sourekii TaxID=87650 RepID=UPI0004865967|nr:ABC transporter ATP-binding protein [Hutsoniella sourekii]
MSSLELKQVTSGYQGVAVIRDINLQIPFGEIVGLVGLNGAGKSTLLKTILGLLTPLSGQIRIAGQSIEEDHQAYASQVAYIPETPILYPELTLEEHLEMTALGYGLDVDLVMKRAQPLLKLFRLDKQLNWFPSHFSKGMKQKVMIICALVTDAKLLIIDEPFLGLDPIAIKDFTELLQERARQGSAILFTTHVLTIAADLCDSYIFLQSGQVVAEGQLEDLQAAFAMPQASLDDLYFEMTRREQVGGSLD